MEAGRTSLDGVGGAVDDLGALVAEEVEAALVLAGLLEDLGVEEEDLAHLDVAVGHIAEHVLVVGERDGRGAVLAGEELGDGEVDPVAAHARLRLEHLEADLGVVVVLAQVDGERSHVGQEVERVLREKVMGQLRARARWGGPRKAATHLLDLDGLFVALEGLLEVLVGAKDEGVDVPDDVRARVVLGAAADAVVAFGLAVERAQEDALHDERLCGAGAGVSAGSSRCSSRRKQDEEGGGREDEDGPPWFGCLSRMD